MLRCSLAIAVPWYAIAAHRVPGFLEFFFIHEHLARYLTPSANREEVWWFFAPVLLLGSLPWTLSALRVLGSGWRRRAQGFDAALFLRLWVLFALVFFSVSDSKLIPYILPALPALALLIAALPEEILERDVARTALMTLGCSARPRHRLLGRARAHGAVDPQRLLLDPHSSRSRKSRRFSPCPGCMCSRSGGGASPARWCF